MYFWTNFTNWHLDISCEIGLSTSCEIGLITSCETGLGTSCKIGLSTLCEICLSTKCEIGLSTSCENGFSTSCEIGLRWVPHNSIIDSIGSGNGTVRQQAITWANALSDLCCHMPSLDYNELTHWGRDEMAAIFQTPFANGFSWMKLYEFRLKFHWSLFLGVELTIFQHWFRLWLGADQATSHYLNQWWLVHWRIYASLGHNVLIPSSDVSATGCN